VSTVFWNRESTSTWVTLEREKRAVDVALKLNVGIPTRVSAETASTDAAAAAARLRRRIV
jgi:hypothetical protein